MVLLRAAMQAQPPKPLGERVIGCDHHPAVAPSTEILAWKERIASRPPKFARQAPFPVNGAARSDRLSRVLDDLHASPSGDRQQTLHGDRPRARREDRR